MKKFIYSMLVAVVAMAMVGCGGNEPESKGKGATAMSKLSYSQVDVNGKIYNVEANVRLNYESGTQYVDFSGDGLNLQMDLGKCWTETTIDLADPKPNPSFASGDPQFMLGAGLTNGPEYVNLFSIHTDWENPDKLIIMYGEKEDAIKGGSFKNSVNGKKYSYEGWINFENDDYVAFKVQGDLQENDY